MAYSKAVREFKKESGGNVKSNPKKQTKNSKQVASEGPEQLQLNCLNQLYAIK
jgi:hypothetical protein